MASARSLANICVACGIEYDTVKRIPKFLKCYHTFCLLCLQSRISDGTTIKCPDCNEETIQENLQTNFYVNIKPSLPAITETFGDVDSKKKHYYWCLTCNATVVEDTSCLKNHDTRDLETGVGRERAENYLKTLFFQRKAQWNGCLAKHRETQSAFKEARIALQAVKTEIDNRSKDNEYQIKSLQKKLSSVGSRLSKPIEEKETGEDIHRLFHEYKQQIDSERNKTSEFDSIRNAVVSVDIHNSNGVKLTIPLFNSALIKFPSEGANEQESHLLTSLSTLILLSTQKEQWESTSSLQQKQTLEPKKKPIQAKAFAISESKIKTTETESKTKTFGSQSKEECFGRDVERKTTSKPLTRAVSDAGKRPEHFLYTSKREKFIPSSHHTDSNRNEKKGYARPIKEEHLTLDESTKLNPSSPVFQPSSTTFQGSTYNFSQPAMKHTPLMSLQNKKVCFTLAVNGKHYGNIVIDLRPDLAPKMCNRFTKSCQVTEGPTYQGTTIYQSKPKTFIMGGKVLGSESLYIADLSPLKKTRGAIFFRLKRDYVKTQCSIVSTEFCIHLGEESHENHLTSTVFGYVSDGLAVCDAISYMNCSKEHIAIIEAKII